MKKVFTLKHLIASINNVGRDVDVYVDGIDGIAVCPPVRLTKEGKEHFARALSLPVEGYCVMGESKDYEDLFEYEEENKGVGGRLILAWDLLKSQAGFCACSDHDKWFEK